MRIGVEGDGKRIDAEEGDGKPLDMESDGKPLNAEEGNGKQVDAESDRKRLNAESDRKPLNAESDGKRLDPEGNGMRLDVEGVSVDVGAVRLVEDITMRVDSGAFVGLVGPNGSGKSTLLRCVYRALRPAAGAVRLDGEDIHRMDPRGAARVLAALPQESSSEFDFTVAEVVAMGRLPHQGRTAAGDREICGAALERTGIAHLADRGFLALSGGEKQRVLIARALAQQPRVLVLDEPTNHLDIAHQLDVLSLVRTSGLTVLAALHDLNLAAAHCDLLYVVAGGRLVASGPPHDVLQPALLAEVFGVRAHPVRHPETGAVQLLFDLLPTSLP